MSALSCDLHTHSNCSDGSDDPGILVKKAAEAGLQAIALTDHDTVSGLAEAGAEALTLGIECVPGIEFGVLSSKGNMHILGYFIDPTDRQFSATLQRVQAARAERTPKLIKRFNELGISITFEELESITKGGQVGRPHFARLLVEKGYVKDFGHAFSKYLARGAKAYVPKSILSPGEAIQAIHSAHGLAVLAHPFSLQCTSRRELETVVQGLCQQGLDGMECWYSEHSPSFTGQCLDIARKFNIVATGGSDYHGAAKPYIKLGSGKGNLVVPYECVKALRARHEEKYGA